MAAAQAFDRLIQRDGIEKLEPLTLYKAAIAFNRGSSKEDKENKEKVWKQLQDKAPGRPDHRRSRPSPWKTPRSTSTASAAASTFPSPTGPWWAATPAAVARASATPPSWSTAGATRCSPDRNTGPDRWIVGDPDTSVIRRLESKGEAVIPAFAPVTATVTDTTDGKQKTLILYRDYQGVVPSISRPAGASGPPVALEHGGNAQPGTGTEERGPRPPGSASSRHAQQARRADRELDRRHPQQRRQPRLLRR